MDQKVLPRSLNPVYVEMLENRTLLSAVAAPSMPLIESPAAAPVVERAAKASRLTTTTLRVSHHTTVLGQRVVLSVRVKQAKGAAQPAGTVEIIDNGATVQDGSAGPLDLTLSPSGRATYVSQVGKVAFYPGFHNLSAFFAGSNALFGSVSKSVLLLVKAPKLRAAPDGFAKATVAKGHGSATVKAGQTVTVSYTGFLQGNGAVFDDAGAHSPPSLTFTVQAGQVIPGFDRGVLGMKLGEIRVVVVPAALGYGANGAGNDIPPNAALLFLVKLLSIT